jgi:ammonia channel protein AmtB
VFPNPFPALLIGFLAGVLTTFLNSKKKSLNDKGVFDSLGSSIVFFIPSFLGALYSAILFATSPYGPDNTDATVQMLQGRTRWGQGGFQLVGIAITLGIAIVCGLLIGLFSKCINSVDGPGDLFNDHNYIEQDVSAELRQVKEVRVQQ